MKKINGGFGKEIEVSDEIIEDIDPESMLSDTIPEIKKEKIVTGSLPEDQIVMITHLVIKDEEYKVTGLFKTFSISDGNLECEFYMLRKHFPILLKLEKMQLEKFTFFLEDEEKEFQFGLRIVKKIDFEFFGKQIKCHIFA